MALKCTTLNSSSHIITVQPSSSILMFCETKSLTRPRINISSNVNLTFYNSTVRVSNDSLIYSQPIKYSAPTNDLDAFRQNGRKIKCQHEKHVCYMQLNVLFNPFIDTSVASNQILNINQVGVVECPIRAPNFPPYRYVLVWNGPDERASLIQNYTLTSYFFYINRVSLSIHNKTFKCSLFQNQKLLFEAKVKIFVDHTQDYSSLYYIFFFCILGVWIGQEGVRRFVRERPEGAVTEVTAAAAASSPLIPSPSPPPPPTPPPPPPPPHSSPMSSIYETAFTSSEVTLRAANSIITNLTLK